jgi:hypothetical protein
MAFFDYNVDTTGTQLLPPQLRQPIHLEWLRVVLSQIKYLYELFFNSFIAGNTSVDWNPLFFYAPGDYTVWTDKAVYINTFLDIGTPPTGDINSAKTWRKVQELFIGVDERVKYNSQLIVFEYALNKYFRVPTTDPQIYIENTALDTNVFLMGNSGETSSAMYNNSVFTEDFMFNAPTFTGATTAYTIWVKAALFTSLGATALDRENTVRQFADKYNLAGLTYKVDTF